MFHRSTSPLSIKILPVITSNQSDIFAQICLKTDMEMLMASDKELLLVQAIRGSRDLALVQLSSSDGKL